jgi:hypothetical protein
MSFDALVRLALSFNGGSPLLVRSAFSRHPIAADIAARFPLLGLDEALAHATPAATPFCWASVGLSSFGEIRLVCPIRVWRPFSTEAAGPTSPLVASAPTTPPPDGFGVEGGAAFPAPPPHPASAAAAETQQRASAALDVGPAKRRTDTDCAL